MTGKRSGPLPGPRLSGLWCAVAAGLLAAGGVAAADTVDQVAAEVNGERIMLSEVMRDLRGAISLLPPALTPAERKKRVDELVRERLFQVIHDRILLQAAERDLSAQDKKAVEARVTDRILEAEREASSRAALVDKLRVEGKTLDDLRTDVRRRTMLAYYVSAKTRPGLYITRQQVLEYYDRHRAQFERAERRSWRIIAIQRTRFARPAEARARADDVQKRLSDGADFRALVTQFSQGLHEDEGGLWGPMARNEFAIRDVTDAVFALNAGQVSPVIETDRTFYLVKVESVEPAATLSLADAQDDITTKLTDAELTRRRRELLDRLQAQTLYRVYYKGLSE